MSKTKISKFARQLQLIRQSKSLSQLELANLSDLQATAISHYENATRRPSLANLRKLAKALQVSVDYLIGHSKYELPLGERCLIGCREIVAIPNWDISKIIAKIDTGAKTSTIHVANLEHKHGDIIHFDVVLNRKKPRKMTPVKTKYIRCANIKSSNGHIQERLVVKEVIQIGNIEKEVELTLSIRNNMICRMLLGRTSLQNDFLINVDDKFLTK